MQWRTLLAVAAAGAALGLVTAAPAGAAGGPGNDNPGGATVIGSLPFKLTQTTGGATSSNVERRVNEQCGAPVVRKGVWLKYTATGSFRLKVSGEGSSYSVGFIVATGPPASATVLGCGPVALVQEVTKGTTYWILAFDDTPGSAGGTLRLQVSRALPPPAVGVQVHATGVAKPATGAARLFGTASCKGAGSRLVHVSASVSQAAGTPDQVNGLFVIGLTVRCGDTPIRWQADAYPEPSFPPDPAAPPVVTRFRPGPVDVGAQALACNVDGCGSAATNLTVTLRRP